MRSLVTAADLEHIPGEAGLPYLGCAVEFLRDTYGLCRRHQAQYGPIVRVKFLGEQVVALYGLDAMEMLLEDRDQILSSAAGWWLLRGIGDGGLSLRDFDEHRAHRNVIQEAFRSSAMAGYLTGLNMQVAGAVKEWPETLDIHDASKRLILRL
ncbi:MAG: cytochrome P450, partial [Pseudomonadota bacterium]